MITKKSADVETIITVLKYEVADSYNGNGRRDVGIEADIFKMYHPDFYSDVMMREPNGYGLHDMLGNAYEWVDAEWNENAYLLLANGITPECVNIPGGEACANVIRGGGILHSTDVLLNDQFTRLGRLKIKKDASLFTAHIGERRPEREAAGFRLVMDDEVYEKALALSEQLSEE